MAGSRAQSQFNLWVRCFASKMTAYMRRSHQRRSESAISSTCNGPGQLLGCRWRVRLWLPPCYLQTLLMIRSVRCALPQTNLPSLSFSSYPAIATVAKGSAVKEKRLRSSANNNSTTLGLGFADDQKQGKVSTVQIHSGLNLLLMLTRVVFGLRSPAVVCLVK